MTDQDIIRCANICDDEPAAQVCELMFHDFGKRTCFHGEAVTFSTYEDNKEILDVIRRDGKSKVLVVDGRGSMRRALCGGNIAAEACKQGWELWAKRLNAQGGLTLAGGDVVTVPRLFVERTFYCLVIVWDPSFHFWIQTHLKCLISSHYVDF